MTFSLYVEPEHVLKDRREHHLSVGLGSDGDLELAYIHIGDHYRHNSDITLTRDQLEQAIQSLSAILTAMDSES